MLKYVFLMLFIACQTGLAHADEDDLLGDTTVDEDELLIGEPEDDLLFDGDISDDDLTLEAPDAAGDDILSASDANEASDAHQALFLENRFPSATTCAKCHADHFREWSVSQHAYAQLSPVFHSMHATIVKKTKGTNGDFCIRCHTQVGMQINEPLFMSNLDRHPSSREGITCIVCHRVKQDYGKVSGRTAIVEGDIFEPVFGPKGGEILQDVLDKKNKFKVVTSADERGRGIHNDAIKHNTMAKPGFCGSCHDVNLLNGFRLEEAFSQFKNTPAAKRGETCQDCHMGKIPGIASGYHEGPAAVIGGKPTEPRKRTNHIFAGPDYSVVHPGIFPHNVEAQQMATMREWLLFKYQDGWGTDAFEENLPEDYKFPDRWKSIDDRYDARAILDEQFKLLEVVNQERYQIMRRGLQLGDFVVEENDADELRFRIQVKNGTDGHGVPTGFDAERLFFLQVTVTDNQGQVIFRSGDRDPNGDVRDLHSAYVHNWELPEDKFLFSLQSKFLTRNIRGGEREQILAVNHSIDPLPYIRPNIRPNILLARPDGARKQAKILPPLRHRWAEYEVEDDQLTGNIPYQVNVKVIAQMIPVNLIGVISEVGFDYNLSPLEIARRVVDNAAILWDEDVILDGRNTQINLSPTEEKIMAPPYKPFTTVVNDTSDSDEKGNSAALSAGLE